MQKMTLEDTQKLVNSYVKTYGQSGAAQKLTEQGYRSPMCATILQAHICRIMNGSSTCLLAPEQENQQQELPITREPIAAIPKRATQIAEELFANEELLKQEMIRTGEQLKQELEEEQRALEEMERSQPPMVPLIESHPYREARHLERDIRISAVFNRRGPVQLDEEATFYGIPRLKHSKPAVIESRPYQPRSYGRNSLSTRDLSVREK